MFDQISQSEKHPPDTSLQSSFSQHFLFPFQSKRLQVNWKARCHQCQEGLWFPLSEMNEMKSVVVLEEAPWSVKWIDSRRALCSSVYIIHIHRMTSEASFHGDRSGGNISLVSSHLLQSFIVFCGNVPVVVRTGVFWIKQTEPMAVAQGLSRNSLPPLPLLLYWITCKIVTKVNALCVSSNPRMRACFRDSWHVVWSHSCGGKMLLHGKCVWNINKGTTYSHTDALLHYRNLIWIIMNR